eukprot:11878939-Heterocapsa_arctica.AAC.1
MISAVLLNDSEDNQETKVTTTRDPTGSGNFVGCPNRFPNENSACAKAAAKAAAVAACARLRLLPWLLRTHARPRLSQCPDRILRPTLAKSLR